MSSTETKTEIVPEPTSSRRRQWLTGVVAVLVLAAIGGAAYYYWVARWYESTEDAYANGNVVQISAQTAGTVISIGADNNQQVAAAQVVVELDPSDARASLGQAEANLARTVRQVRGLYANVGGVQAEMASRRVMLERAQADYERRKYLAATGAIAAEELAHARETLSAAASALASSGQQLATSHALVDNTALRSHPDVQSMAAALRRAALDFSRTRLKTPVSGYVAQRSVQLGQRVLAGSPLMAGIPLNELWVEVNFKETQLRHMRIGQPVRLVSDLYGSDVVYRGKIQGLGVGTGSAFALLPAQNATGNWIKIVQRVPVRVTLDPAELAAHPLKIGLSLHAEVDLHDQTGPALAPLDHASAVSSTDIYADQLTEVEAKILRIIDENAGEKSTAPTNKRAP